MKKENEKKGFLARLLESKKGGKNSCCCSFEIEEIPKDFKDEAIEGNPNDKNKDSCC